MADRWAFLVGIDKHLDPEFGMVPYAEAGTKSLGEALTAAGYAAERQVVLLGSQATKTVIESRLRRLKKSVKRGDTVVFYFAGRGLPETHGLAAWDTQPDDRDETAIEVRELVASLTSTKAGEVVLLLEANTGDLTSLLRDSPKAVCLAASTEEPLSAAALKAGVWTHAVVEALSGRAAKAMDGSGRVTAMSLHGAVEAELPRLLRKHFDPGVAQAPQLFGEHNAGAVLADLSHLAGGSKFLLDADRLRRVMFRSETTTRVKDLTAWRKTYDPPERSTPSARSFVARVSNPDVKTDLDLVFAASRELFAYKRKDVTVETGPDGFGAVRTPDFEYSVTAGLDATDPTRVLWRREVGGFRDAGFVRSAEFDALFGKMFDALVFEFGSPIDVGKLVDRLEDHPPKGVTLRVESAGTSCEIGLKGFAGRVIVERHSLIVRGRTGQTAGLLDQLLAFLAAVGPLNDRLMLKG